MEEAPVTNIYENCFNITDNLAQRVSCHAHAGGIWMIPIAIVLTFAIAFTVERFFRLYLQYSVDGKSFMFKIQQYILGGDIDGAIRTCNGAPDAALPKIIKAGLQRASKSEEQIQNAVDAASLEMIPKLEKRLPFMALIANIATLLGLLGTIWGLMRSFAGLETADPAQRATLISKGIAEAMNCTAFGLFTAIFTMVCHSFLSNKATAILGDLDEFGVKLVDHLGERNSRHTTESQG